MECSSRFTIEMVWGRKCAEECMIESFLHEFLKYIHLYVPKCFQEGKQSGRLSFLLDIFL